MFTSVDLFLFFLFWELELIPMFLIIGIWGGARREYAAFKFILYTVAGSAFMLVGIFLVAYFGAAAADLRHSRRSRAFDFSQYGRGIAVARRDRVHPAVPRLRRESADLPVPHLAARRARRGADRGQRACWRACCSRWARYGLLRLCVTLLPQAAHDWQWLLIILAVVNSVYGAFVALAQTDLKKMIANSSISHMGYVILGIAALNQVGFQGALLVMIAHGLYSGLLFSMVGLVYDRTHTREVGAMRGLAARMPFIASGVHDGGPGVARVCRAGRLRRRVHHVYRRVLGRSRWRRSCACARSRSPPGTSCGGWARSSSGR